MRCLPTGRIKRTNVGGKIVFQENPSFAGFGAGYIAGFGLGLQQSRGHFQEGCGLFESKCPHSSFRLVPGRVRFIGNFGVGKPGAVIPGLDGCPLLTVGLYIFIRKHGSTCMVFLSIFEKPRAGFFERLDTFGSHV